MQLKICNSKFFAVKTWIPIKINNTWTNFTNNKNVNSMAPPGFGNTITRCRKVQGNGDKLKVTLG